MIKLKLSVLLLILSLSSILLCQNNTDKDTFTLNDINNYYNWEHKQQQIASQYNDERSLLIGLGIGINKERQKAINIAEVNAYRDLTSKISTTIFSYYIMKIKNKTARHSVKTTESFNSVYQVLTGLPENSFTNTFDTLCSVTNIGNYYCASRIVAIDIETFYLNNIEYLYPFSINEFINYLKKNSINN